MGLINSDYNICTILHNMCHGKVFNQVFNTHYNLNFTKYKEFIILYGEIGKWAAGRCSGL